MSIGATAIVLGRAGSRGVPGKNMARVAGRPCAAWTIADARGAETIGRVAVSSDCHEMLRLARSLGATPIVRDARLASDDATVDDATRHAVERLDALIERAPDERDVFVLLYANVPVRPAGLFDRAVRALVDSGADSVQSYAPVGKRHPWWTVRLDADGVASPWEGDVLNHGVYRRQDLPPAFVPDGGVIALTRRALFRRVEGATAGPHAFLGADRRGVETREGEVIDIDAAVDLSVADAMLRRGVAG